MLNIVSLHTPVSAGMASHVVLEQLIERCRGLPALPVAVVQPCSEVALAGMVEATRAGIIAPICVGDKSASRRSPRASKSTCTASILSISKTMPPPHGTASRCVATVKPKH